MLDIAPTVDVRAIEPTTWAPYQPTVWDDVPPQLRGRNAEWVSSYYGVVAIATNADVLDDRPTTFAALADPKYVGQVTLTGDPSEDATAFAVVMAAALANGGSLDDVMPGIEYFADLRAGGSSPTPRPRSCRSTRWRTPVVLAWSTDVARLAGIGDPRRRRGRHARRPAGRSALGRSVGRCVRRLLRPGRGRRRAAPQRRPAVDRTHAVARDRRRPARRRRHPGPARWSRRCGHAPTSRCSVSCPRPPSSTACASPARSRWRAALEVIVENWAPMVADLPSPPHHPGEHARPGCLTVVERSHALPRRTAATPICRARPARGLRFRPMTTITKRGRRRSLGVLGVAATIAFVGASTASATTVPPGTESSGTAAGGSAARRGRARRSSPTSTPQPRRRARST